MGRKRRDGNAVKQQARTPGKTPAPDLKDGDKDWETPCQICGELPTVHPTALCGPCCFGEAETIGGDW